MVAPLTVEQEAPEIRRELKFLADAVSQLEGKSIKLEGLINRDKVYPAQPSGEESLCSLASELARLRRSVFEAVNYLDRVEV